MAADQVHSSYLSAKCIETIEHKWKDGGEKGCLIIELYLYHLQRSEYHVDFKHVFKPTKLTDLNSFMNYVSSNTVNANGISHQPKFTHVKCFAK